MPKWNSGYELSNGWPYRKKKFGGMMEDLFPNKAHGESDPKSQEVYLITHFRSAGCSKMEFAQLMGVASAVDYPATQTYGVDCTHMTIILLR